ncbi:MAG TPA: hypothetical protein VJ805_02335 [Nitrospiraceae bacterium]|nr:hypothetical protein [Nitrospiraceae bacterium]
MTTGAIVFLAMTTCLAAGSALWIALAFIERERRMQQKKASVLRAQLVAQLHTVREFVVPRGRPLDPMQKEIYEPIQFLWMQADLLEPVEVQAVNRCISALLALRHKASLNQTQARFALRLIDETCSLLQFDVPAPQPADRWSLAQRLIRELPGFPSIRTDGVTRSPQSPAATEISMLKN